ncbi:MAG: hypothetical protein JNM84_22000 [Planctomycetes bacterium]|nr:hypothetical protein [Planctomycetota bacterium]
MPRTALRAARRPALLASFLLASQALALGARAEELPQLWRTHAAPPAATLEWIAEQQQAHPAFGAAHAIALDLAVLEPLIAAPERPLGVAVELGAERLELVLERSELQPLYRVFRGHRAGSEDRCAFVVSSDGIASGWLEHGARRFALAQHGASATHVVREVREAQLRPCGCGAEHEVADELQVACNEPESIPAVTIDVIAFFTPAARRTQGSASALASVIGGDIERANEANLRANVDLRFRLVHARETSYVEDGTGNDLSRFRSTNDGVMDEVHGLRNQYGADLCTLITDFSSEFCGVAYLMTTPGSGFRSSAFSVNVRSCLGGTVVAHEMGHNLGCAHDRQNASRGAYSYSFGYRTPDSAWRTVMSYTPGAGVTTWSNPAVVHQGQAMGTATEDNARSIRNTMRITAAFTAQQILDAWVLDGGVPTGFGLVPILQAAGFVNGLEAPTLRFAAAPNGAPGALVIGLVEARQPFFGGTLIPALQLPIPITGSFFATTADISSLLTLPSGTELWLQALFLDPLAAQGVAMSHGLYLRRP